MEYQYGYFPILYYLIYCIPDSKQMLVILAGKRCCYIMTVTLLKCRCNFQYNGKKKKKM